MAHYLVDDEGLPSLQLVAFVLRPTSKTQTTFNDRIVYTLETCMMVPAPLHNDRMRLGKHATWKEWAGLTEYLSWEQFCLE